VTLPRDIPAKAFTSLTLHDYPTRPMLQTPQNDPRTASQSDSSPAVVANAGGSTTVYFGPAQPRGMQRGHWSQTMRGKGWFLCLRLCSPVEYSSPENGESVRLRW